MGQRDARVRRTEMLRAGGFVQVMIGQVDGVIGEDIGEDLGEFLDDHGTVKVTDRRVS